jgi:endonuclease YncB( thermonuclease family)
VLSRSVWLVVACGLALAAPARAEEMPGPVRAEVLAVVDGDTLRVRAHVWLGQSIDVLVRIRGIDTPELRGACAGEKERARAAAVGLAAALEGDSVVLTRIAGDKYFGRVVADVATAGGADLATGLLRAGFGRPYEGGRRAGWCG